MRLAHRDALSTLRKRARPSWLFAVVITAACSSTYYGAMEKMGWHKRDLLVDRVKDARDVQEATKEEFRDALETFSSVVNFDGGDLQQNYDRLRRAYDRSESKATQVRKRIGSVEKVASDLFKEWEKELTEYSNPDFRRSSENQLHETRRRYEGLIDVMKRAEAKMSPVLTALNDQVLYLKHNLNARAIASLQGTAAGIQNDVASLIAEMEAAINEADQFIREMGEQGA